MYKPLTAQELGERERLKAWMAANGHDSVSLAEATGDFRTNVHIMLTHPHRRISQGFKWRLRRAFGNAVADQLFPDEAPQVEMA